MWPTTSNSCVIAGRGYWVRADHSVVIAYEPVRDRSAVVSADAQGGVRRSERVGLLASPRIADTVRVLYGGSVNAKTSATSWPR